MTEKVIGKVTRQVIEEVQLEVLASSLAFPESPVVEADGSVLVSEVAAGRVSRVLPGGTTETVARTGGGPNGVAPCGGGTVGIASAGSSSARSASIEGNRISRSFESALRTISAVRRDTPGTRSLSSGIGPKSSGSCARRFFPSISAYAVSAQPNWSARAST